MISTTRGGIGDAKVGATSHRILFVSPVPPFDQTSGTHQRTHLLFSALRAVGEVDVLIVQPGAETTAAAERAEATVVKATVPERNDLGRFRPNAELTARVEYELGQPMRGYALIVGRYLWAVSQLRVPDTVPILADLDDFRYRYSPCSAMVPRAIIERIRKSLAYQLSKRQLPRLASAFFASYRDKADNPGVISSVLRNVPVTSGREPTVVSDSATVLFVGSLWYRPNQEAMDWFVKLVWPRVLAVRPDATLRIVGAASRGVLSRWAASRNVETAGFVNDLRGEYARAAVVIAPIHSGGGSNIKVLEGMAYGCACVTTRFCYEALVGDLEAGVDLLVAGDERTFATHVCRLLSDRAHALRVAASGYRAVLGRFTIEHFNATAAGLALRTIDRYWAPREVRGMRDGEPRS